MMKPYPQWRAEEALREEDAANLLGHYLVRHCRKPALDGLPRGLDEKARAAVREAVDVALCGVMDLLEGYWPLPAGEGYAARLALHVEITRDGQPVESIPVSPSRVDLPIGYWGWIES